MTFLQAAQYAYEGVQLYLLKFARLAFVTAVTVDPLSSTASDRKNLQDVARRMLKLALHDGTGDLTFHDAAQMIFSMHCCLHLVGQAVSVGRLDQLLIGYYQNDIRMNRITPERVWLYNCSPYIHLCNCMAYIITQLLHVSVRAL